MRANKNIIRSVAAAAGVSAMIAATPVFAADVIFDEPPAPAPAPFVPAPVTGWEGPYAGFSLGYGFGRTNTSGPAGFVDTNGFIGSAFLGFNAQSDAFVYGIEADVGYNFGHDGARFGPYASQLGWEGSLRARLGYAVTDNALIYLTGGGAVGTQRFIDGVGADRHTHFGWTVGAGVDAKLTEQVFGRIEYRYTDYGAVTYNTGSGPQSIDNNHHRVGVGVGFRF